MLDADFFFYYINYTLWNMYNVKIYTDTTNKFDNISIRHKDRIITNSNRYFFRRFCRTRLFLPFSVCFHGFVPEQFFQGAVDYKRSSTTDTAA